MKTVRLIVVLLVAACAGSAALADGIDPTVVVRRNDPPPIAITSIDQVLSFTLTAGNNEIAFQNQTGILITSLVLTVTGNVALDFTCQTDVFASCTVTDVNSKTAVLDFSGIDADHTGIAPADCPPAESEGIESFFSNNNNYNNYNNCDQCTGGILDIAIDGIPRGDRVSTVGTLNTGVPEPASALLLMSGIAGLAAFRKRRAA